MRLVSADLGSKQCLRGFDLTNHVTSNIGDVRWRYFRAVFQLLRRKWVTAHLM